MPNRENGHYLAYAFPMVPTLEEKFGGGGLAATIAREVSLKDGKDSPATIKVLSPDEKAVNLADYGLEILDAAEESVPNGDRFGVWFGDQWVIFHTQVHIAEGGYPNEILEKLFRGGEYSAPEGALSRAVEHVEKFGFLARNPKALAIFADRFDRPIEAISPHSIINWQDYMFYPSMLRHGAELREKGCWQSYHHHVPISEQLPQFSQGREFLKALSLMDRVYVHTDTYARRLEQQLEEMKLPTPEIKRFDLGVDAVRIEQRLERITKDTYKESAEYKGLPRQQQTMIDEIVGTQDTDLHRFVLADRADQGKGQTVVLEGMDRFLSTLSSQEQAEFRFYFILPQLDWELIDYQPQHQYIKLLRNKLKVMREKYPGVFYYMPGLPPGLIPLVQRDAHTITGGMQDGLCLSPLEALKVNALTGHNRSGIIGMGTGFAIQTSQNERHRHLISFVRQGNIEEMALAIKSAAAAESNDSASVGRQTRQLVSEVIDRRTDGVIVYP